MKTTLRQWFRQLEERFDSRELDYLSAHKAEIRLQLKDQETGQIALHEVVFTSKEAQDLVIA